MYVCMYYVCMHACMQVCMYICVCMYVCIMYVCVCVYVCMYCYTMYVYVCIHIYVPVCNACINVCGRSWYSNKATAWTILFSIVDRDKKSLSCVGTFSPTLRPTGLHIENIPDFFLRRQSGRGVMLNAQLRLVPRLKMSDAIVIFPLDAFIASSPQRRKRKLPICWWN